jgi:hypothetical protein
VNPPPPVVPNLEHARAEVLTFAKRLGDTLRNPHGGAGKFDDIHRAQRELEEASKVLSAALAGVPL